AVLAHDIRNHLVPMRGRAQMIRRRAAREARSADLLDAAALDASIDRLAELVTDVLDATRLQRGLLALQRQTFDIMELTHAIARSMRTPDVAVSVRASAPRVAVCGDVARLRQALENLVANAVRHAPIGTTVVITVTS